MQGLPREALWRKYTNQPSFSLMMNLPAMISSNERETSLIQKLAKETIIALLDSFLGTDLKIW